MVKVAMNQWIRKGYRKDLVRQATSPNKKPPKMVE